MKKFKRMKNPDDALIKRQSAYACDVMHEYHELPGKYAGLCVNEYPSADGRLPRTDSCYFIQLQGKKYIINLEDESTKVDLKTLEKINTYKINIEYGTKKPVISVIRTILPLDSCVKEYWHSPTSILKPIIISLSDMDGEIRLNNIEKKVKNNKCFSNVEAMDFVMIPKMFNSNQHLILEKLCNLLKHAKIKDERFKTELILQMRCVIHRYAKTLEDIEKLEGGIEMQKVMTAREYQDQLLINRGERIGIRKGERIGIRKGERKGIRKGEIKGKLKGEFNLALKIKDKFGIEHALELTKFSRQELETEKLNLDNYL